MEEELPVTLEEGTKICEARMELPLSSSSPSKLCTVDLKSTGKRERHIKVFSAISWGGQPSLKLLVPKNQEQTLREENCFYMQRGPMLMSQTSCTPSQKNFWINTGPVKVWTHSSAGLPSHCPNLWCENWDWQEMRPCPISQQHSCLVQVSWVGPALVVLICHCHSFVWCYQILGLMGLIIKM